jgi:O-antigen/teichoic acid export membrane protein
VLALSAGSAAAVTGTLWVIVSNLLTRGLSFVGQVIMGWLLVPEDFGIWALAVSISTAVGALRNGGTSQILIRRGHDYAAQAAPVFRFSLAFNILAMLLLIAVAALMRTSRPAVAIVLLGLAISIPIGTPAMLLKAKLTIDRRFRELATINFGSSFIWQAAVVGLAFGGLGAMSFALPPLLQAAYESVASWRATKAFPNVRTHAQARDYWLLFRESRWVMLSAMALGLATTGDYFAVAMLTDVRTAGIYFFAFQLVVAISAPLYGALETVLPPLFTQLNDDRPRQIAACTRTLRVMMGAGAPAAATFALGAPLAIHFIWHGVWDEAIPVARILAACVPAWLLVSAGRALIEARGLWRARFMVLGLYGLGGISSAALGTLFHSVGAIAACVAAFYVSFSLVFVLVLGRLGLPLRATAAAILAPLALTGVALVSAWLLAASLAPEAGSYSQSGVALLTFLVIVALGNVVFFRELWREILSILTRRIRRGTS